MANSRRGLHFTRRSFLVSTAGSLAAGKVVGLTNKTAWAKGVDTNLMRARNKAAHRRRRLIRNDDGDLVYCWDPETPPEEFCGFRLEPCVGTPVDSYAWCMMWGIAVGNPARTRNTAIRYWEVQQQGKPFHPKMPDPTPVMITFAKRHGIEMFGSIRMNDCHDGLGMPGPNLKYPLKVEHPEFLLGDESQRRRPEDGNTPPLAAWMWAGMNYAHPEVREDRFWWINHAARTYDLDGVDLNFFRHPWFFELGEESRHMHLMTDVIRRARRRFDQISVERGRPVLLGVRVPGTVETCLRIGLDIETWLKEGLVDRMCTGGGYVPFSTPAEELIELGHRHDVPVYPSINCPIGIMNERVEALRGAASNMWYAGGDGIYLWNYYHRKSVPRPKCVGYGEVPPEEQAQPLHEIGEPKNLARLDKIFAVDCTAPIRAYARASAPCPLPLDLGTRADEKRHNVPVRIGDNIPVATKSGALRDTTLQLKVADKQKGDRVHVRFNGLELGNGTARDKGWADFVLDPRSVRQGINDLAITVAERGPSARRSLTLEQIWVQVRYRS